MQTILHHDATGASLIIDTDKKRAIMPAELCVQLGDGPHAVCAPGQPTCVLAYYFKGYVYRLQFTLRETDILHTELTSSVLNWFLEGNTAELVQGLSWEDLAPGQEPMPRELLDEFQGIAKQFVATGKRVIAVLGDGPGNDPTTILAVRLMRAASDAALCQPDETKQRAIRHREYRKLLLGADLERVVDCVMAVGLLADALRRDPDRTVVVERDPETDAFIAYTDDESETDPENTTEWHDALAAALVDAAGTIMDALPEEPEEPHVCPDCEAKIKNCRNN